MAIAGIASLPLWAFVFSMVMADSQNQFESPNREENRNWTLGTSRTISLSTGWKKYKVQLWQQDPVEERARVSSSLIYGQDNNLAGGRNSFQWTVQTYGFDLAFSEKFYLRANNLDDDSDATITPYLYFKAAEEQPISSESPAPSSSVTSSMMTGTSSMSNTMTTSTSTTTATTTSPNSPDKLKPTDSSESGGVRKGLSAGEAAGIGVGVGLGVALAASLASFWYFRKKGRQTPTQLATAISHEPPKSEVHTTTPYAPPAEMSHYTRPVEMHDPLAVPEMPYQSKPAQLGP